MTMDDAKRPQAAQPAAEIPDTDRAPTAIRALYDDIRSTLSTPVVNLVFRRLAGLGEDVLETAWSRLRPAYLDGRIEAAAALLPGAAGTLERPRDFDLATVKQRASLSPGDWVRVSALLGAYDHNNRRNLVAFTALLADLPQDGRPVAPLAAPPARASCPEVDLPPLPAIACLDPQTRAAIDRLNTFGDDDPPGPMASLYLHLSWWPPLLAAAEGLLRPYELRGELFRSRMAVIEAVGQLVDHFPDTSIDRALRERLAPVIGPLTKGTIPKMIPIGRLMLDVVSAGPCAGARDKETGS